MDSTVRSRISAIETDFLNAITSNNDQLLRTFEGSWCQLQEDVERYVSDGLLDTDTMDIVHGVATRVSILADSLLELETLSSQTGVFEDIVSDISLQEIESNSKVTKEAAYIEAASRWLSDNLHNPYPDMDTRKRIARQSNSPLKDVSAWFTDARKRIGWNALRRLHFSNKRADIVDAATRFFTNDFRNSICPTLESAFVDVELRARDLYSRKYENTRLANALDRSVKDMTVELQQQLGRTKAKPSRSRRKSDRSIMAYPSPESSPSRSPSRSLSSPEPSGLNDRCAETTPSSGKRSRSTALDDSDLDLDTSATRPAKRTRMVSASKDARMITGLLSPSPSLDSVDFESASPRNDSPLSKLRARLPLPQRHASESSRSSTTSPSERGSTVPTLLEAISTPGLSSNSFTEWMSDPPFSCLLQSSAGLQHTLSPSQSAYILPEASPSPQFLPSVATPATAALHPTATNQSSPPVRPPVNLFGHFGLEQIADLNHLFSEMPPPVSVDVVDTQESVELEMFDFSTCSSLLHGDDSTFDGTDIGQMASFNWLESDLLRSPGDLALSGSFGVGSAVFDQDQETLCPSTGTANDTHFSTFLSLPPSTTSNTTSASFSISTKTAHPLTHSQMLAKTKQLLSLEAQLSAIRAELYSS
ncbi:C-terminal domain of homeodomain 1-domain-containing protein [Ephemerocybe angulata]|uniref:C-terminal domain of homeodomain 1-domain-containing protein n=1 Tax=Ephemerocybe angulata TaxID=980116 RepID=A0A8H6IJD7_9AGAR|nr:C-terminal domain of homeodomain 1-domain-containing protein [Tulosesus angulatus]